MSNPSSNANDLSALREIMFQTIRDVKAGSIDLDRAKVVNELGRTLIDSAKVEVDYLRASGGGESSFIDASIGADNLPLGITGRTVHRIRG